MIFFQNIDLKPSHFIHMLIYMVKMHEIVTDLDLVKNRSTW